jgi:hypothetical protein
VGGSWTLHVDWHGEAQSKVGAIWMERKTNTERLELLWYCEMEKVAVKFQD